MTIVHAFAVGLPFLKVAAAPDATAPLALVNGSAHSATICVPVNSDKIAPHSRGNVWKGADLC